MASNYDPILELDYFAHTMSRDGSLPITVSGVTEDSFAVLEIATHDPTQLQADLVNSTIINHDANQANADRITAGLKLHLFEAVANDLSEGTTTHPDGTPLTVEEFNAQREHDKTFAEGLRQRAREQRIADEAKLLWDSNQTHALEQAKYDPNEAVRIYNARRVLGRRAARIALGVSSFIGTASGVVASEVVTTDPNINVLALSASAGTLVGSLVATSLRNRTVRHFARRRANQLLQQQPTEN